MRARSAIAAAALVALVVGVAAQEAFVTLVEVHFVVTDRSGRFVKDVHQEDITVYDNDRRQDVSSFSEHVQAPLNVVMVVDRSQSVSDRFPSIVNAASAFVTSVVRGPQDRGALVAFDSKVYLVQDWTADPEALVAALHELSAAGGSSIFDALFKTCRDEFDPIDPRQNVVVLVTDGEDTTSAATFDQALRMAKMSHVEVYVLGVRAADSLNTRETQGHQILANLAELTGGRVFYPADYTEASLGGMFDALQEELRNGYGLSYYLDVPPDNSFHRVRIQLKDRSLRVQAPTGYFAHQGRPSQ